MKAGRKAQGHSIRKGWHSGRMAALRVATAFAAILAATLLAACGGGSGSAATDGTPVGTAPAAVVSTPAYDNVVGGQPGYAAYVTSQVGCTYLWTVTNGTVTLGQGTDGIAFTPDDVDGDVVVSCRVTNAQGLSATGFVRIPIARARVAEFNMTQALTDQAQGTTVAFSGIGMMTGNLGAQSFFPPGKVADYWGFQYLRDNDPDRMGHNTSFLTRVSCNVLFVLDNAQIAKLKALASSQVDDIALYAWMRYPLMQAFRRLVDNDAPVGKPELSRSAVAAASVDLYRLDGRISYERAAVYADIIRSMSASQKAYLGAMVGKGWNSWPDVDETDVRSVTQGLPGDEVVAMMTYAGDLYSWYAGTVTSDVYFCPERHGTYFGSFYMKDAPAVGHPGYSIDETMTGTVGAALVDSSKGYISAAGAAKMNAIVGAQRANLSDNAAANIVLARTRIAEALRTLIRSEAPSQAFLDNVASTVDAWSAVYGRLDGENNHLYAKSFAEVWNNVGGSYLTEGQRTMLRDLRSQYLDDIAYAGDPASYDFSVCAKFYLFAAEVSPSSAEFLSRTSDAATDGFFE